jgi:hypothetical protein
MKTSILICLLFAGVLCVAEDDAIFRPYDEPPKKATPEKKKPPEPEKEKKNDTAPPPKQPKVPLKAEEAAAGYVKVQVEADDSEWLMKANGVEYIKRSDFHPPGTASAAQPEPVQRACPT